MESLTLTKKDLKSGMMVEIKRGDKALLIPNINGLQLVSLEKTALHYYNWLASIKHYNDNFEHKNGSYIENELDIEKIYNLSNCGRFWKNDTRELLWQREEVKEMTVKEISEELGYKVKVVE